MRERLLTPEELDQLMKDIIKLINGNERLLPKTDTSKILWDYRIEIGTRGYEYVYSERGNEIFRDLAFDLDDLLYRVFKDVTYEMTVKGNDQTEQLKRQLELLTQLRPLWAERKKQERF